MLATIYSRAQFGMQAPPVTIDVHVSAGLPSLAIVGLAEVAVDGLSSFLTAPASIRAFGHESARADVVGP